MSMEERFINEVFQMIDLAENKLYKIATTIWEVIAMGFLWTLFSLPIVTIGPATTALYYVATKKASGKEDEYLFRAFWQSFKGNFIRSFVVSLILGVVGSVAWFNLLLLPYLDLGWLSLVVRLALFFVLVQVVFISSYVFAVIARFETSVLGALKAASFLANRHMILTIMNLILLLAIFYILFIVPIVLLFMMGIYGYFASFLIVKVFRKHYPDFGKSIDGRLEAEGEE